MGGLGLLVLLIGYLWVSIGLTRAAARSLSVPAGTAVGLLLLCLPFVDALAGRALLRSKCASEGGVVISERATGVEGIATSAVFDDSPSYYGYRWVESFPSSSSGLVDRATLNGSEKAEIEKNVQPKAQFQIHEGDRQDSAYFYTTRTSVRKADTSQEMSHFDWFEFRGGWAENIAMSLSDAGPSVVAQCGDFRSKHDKVKELLHTTVQPR